MSKKVSIIIPTLDRQNILINTLKDVLKQDYPDFEIIVVDQTKEPSSSLKDFISKYSQIKYIHLDKKSSPLARNIGVKNASGEIVLFLDDDVEIRDPEFISYHTVNFVDNVGAVGGRVVYDFKDHSNCRAVGRLQYFGLKEITNFNSTFKTEIDHAPGGNLSCYRQVFESVGGFSEIYKGNAHMEETDFCLRVKRAGYKLIFEPKAVLRHLQVGYGGNRADDLYQFRYWLVHNFIVFYLKNYPKILFPLCFMKELTWALGSAIKRGDGKMFKMMFKAIRDGISYYRSLL